MSNAILKFDEVKGKWFGTVNGTTMGSINRKSLEGRLRRELGATSFTVEKGQAQTITAKKDKNSEEYFTVDERFNFIEKFTDMISRKILNSLIITGDGGLGKTYTVLETLQRAGMREITEDSFDGDYIIIKGFSTAKAMYRTLWENNGKIIIFDDADSVHKDAIGANILKGALDSYDKRMISWGAEFKDNEELPNRFEFTGRVIFISNLPINKFPQALLSRSMKVDLTLDTEEKLDRIEHVMGKIDAPRADKQAVIEFVRKHGEKFTDLNIRSAINILTLRKQLGSDFERIALYNAIA